MQHHLDQNERPKMEKIKIFLLYRNCQHALEFFQAGIYLLKVNNRKTRRRLTIKTPEQRHWRPSTVFIVNFDHISHLALFFLLLTLNILLPAGYG